MGLLFSSKVEKALARCKKKELGLEVRYADGNAVHPAQLVRFDKNKLIMTGFAGTLREDSLEIYIPGMNLCLRSRVTHTSHDIKGHILYHCPLPKDLEGGRRRADLFFIYPRGIVVLAPEDRPEKALEDDNMKAEKFYVWNVGRDGLGLLNTTSRTYPKGFRFFAGKIKVGGIESMIDMEVADLVNKPIRNQMAHIIICKFTKPPKNLDALLEICKKIDRL